ncbi:MAG: glycosyltransferase [Gammaproteobacteria bacterium]
MPLGRLATDPPPDAPPPAPARAIGGGARAGAAAGRRALGIAYLEAMRFGLPVIATTAGGAHELVGHGHEGFLVVPGDADALTGHLRLLVA